MGEQQSACRAPFEECRRLAAAFSAFWVSHAVLRVLLLFRPDPYGAPFINRPVGSFFYAAGVDFSWMFLATVPFFVLAWLLSRHFKIRRWISSFYFAVQGLLLLVTFFDQETLRFLGCHLSFLLLDSYGETFSFVKILTSAKLGGSFPYLQLFAAPLLIPVTYGVYRLLLQLLSRLTLPRFRAAVVCCALCFLCTQCALSVMRIGVNEDRKLAPVVRVLYAEWKLYREGDAVTPGLVRAASVSARRFWAVVEGADSSEWTYPGYDYPMYRVPKAGLAPDSLLIRARARHADFIVIYMESYRGLDAGYLNPDAPWESATPVLDSLAGAGASWTRMYASGSPVAGSVLSSHLGFPPHRTRDLAAELAAVNAPGYASVLRDSGYAAEFFSAADPAEDNLSAWYRKWYSRVHFNRALEDDSSFFSASAEYIRDSLARRGKPFVAGLLTHAIRSPSGAVPGMPDSVLAFPLRYRMRWNMRRADRLLGAFLDSIKKEPWSADTYIIVLGDYGLPPDGHGASAPGVAGYPNSTWIPFVICGPALGAPVEHSEVSSQIDIAPTVLALAGLRVANAFTGHDMLRPHPRSFALGVHAGVEAFSFDGFRLLTGLPRSPREGGDAIFAEEDVYESQSLLGVVPDLVNDYHALADTLLFVNDYALSRNHVVKAP
jgi:hypothetical protein